MNLIGRCHALIRRAGPDPNYIEYFHAELVDVDDRNLILNELRALIFELDELNLQDMEINLEGDAFLEYLMNNVRNEVISYQSFITKTVEKSTKELISCILELKKNNFEKISELEIKLREINDIKIRGILKKNSNFDTLHSERVTPFFLKWPEGHKALLQ